MEQAQGESFRPVTGTEKWASRTGHSKHREQACDRQTKTIDTCPKTGELGSVRTLCKAPCFWQRRFAERTPPCQAFGYLGWGVPLKLIHTGWDGGECSAMTGIRASRDGGNEGLGTGIHTGWDGRE